MLDREDLNLIVRHFHLLCFSTKSASRVQTQMAPAGVKSKWLTC